MSTIKDGGQAFPRAGAHIRTLTGEMYDKGDVGMTLRDYFAAKVACGLAANQEWMVNAYKETGEGPHVCVSKAAYEIADGMLAQREAQP